jgi:hypothetical protein
MLKRANDIAQRLSCYMCAPIIGFQTKTEVRHSVMLCESQMTVASPHVLAVAKV